MAFLSFRGCASMASRSTISCVLSSSHRYTVSLTSVVYSHNPLAGRLDVFVQLHDKRRHILFPLFLRCPPLVLDVPSTRLALLRRRLLLLFQPLALLLQRRYIVPHCVAAVVAPEHH